MGSAVMTKDVFQHSLHPLAAKKRAVREAHLAKHPRLKLVRPKPDDPATFMLVVKAGKPQTVKAGAEAIVSPDELEAGEEAIPIPANVVNLLTATLDGSSNEAEIVSLDATALAAKIAAGTYSSVQVLRAYIKVAVIAQDLTNCLTEIFVEEAFERAQQLDDYLKSTGNVVGPLHGVPVSIKDHVLVKGTDSSTGYVAWQDKFVSNRDAIFVQVLREAGALIYVKTANPQSLLSLECENHIYGRTVNIHNRALSSGGSSGGEGALVSSHGSAIGVGTDIGGSIRAPCAHSGLFGFKASVARMPHTGLLGSHDGMDNIVGVVGPMVRSARDIALFCKIMLDAQTYLREAQMLHIPWRQNVVDGEGLPKKLSFALVLDDGVVRPHPPLVDALNETRKALEAEGHEVIVWTPLKALEGWKLIVKLYFLDYGSEYLQTIKDGNEEPTESLKWIMSYMDPEKTLGYSLYETWAANVEREAFRQRGLEYWNETAKLTSTGRPVDAILCPASATLAPLHDKTRWWAYTSHWNLLDYPGAVFPTGKFLNAEDFAKTAAPLPEPMNEIDADVQKLWNPTTYDGAPIALQVVGRRHHEEETLAYLNVVLAAREKHLN